MVLGHPLLLELTVVLVAPLDALAVVSEALCVGLKDPMLQVTGDDFPPGHQLPTGQPRHKSSVASR